VITRAKARVGLGPRPTALVGDVAARRATRPERDRGGRRIVVERRRGRTRGERARRPARGRDRLMPRARPVMEGGREGIERGRDRLVVASILLSLLWLVVRLGLLPRRLLPAVASSKRRGTVALRELAQRPPEARPTRAGLEVAQAIIGDEPAIVTLGVNRVKVGGGRRCCRQARGGWSSGLSATARPGAAGPGRRPTGLDASRRLRAAARGSLAVEGWTSPGGAGGGGAHRLA
jgi:hypothetical protein